MSAPERGKRRKPKDVGMKVFIVVLMAFLTGCGPSPHEKDEQDLKCIGHSIQYLDHTIQFLSDCERAPHDEWVAANCDAQKKGLLVEKAMLDAERKP